MDFIGHVAAQAVVWRPAAEAGPGTEWEAQRSGLFGARPQAAGERAEEEVLLAGSGELSQALLLLLGLGDRRRRGGSVGMGRASSQGSQFPALSLGEISAQPRPSPPKPQNARPDMARASSEPQKPRLKSWYPQDPLPQIPGGLSPQPWEPIYPNLDAGRTPQTFNRLLHPVPWVPNPSPEPYKLCLHAGESQA